MRRDYEEFRRRGAEIVVITQGDASQAETFRQSHDIPFPCLADPQRRAYAAYGLSRGSVLQILGPRVWWRGIQAARKGFGLGKPVGDPRQMPGVFIVNREGKICFAYRSRDASDNPPNDLLLASLPMR